MARRIPGVRAVLLSTLTMVLVPLMAMADRQTTHTHTGDPEPPALPGSDAAVTRAAVLVARELATADPTGESWDWPLGPRSVGLLLINQVRASGRLWAWAVGDPDPWADGPEPEGDQCLVRSPHMRVCTVLTDCHDGPHAASDGQQMVEVWW